MKEHRCRERQQIFARTLRINDIFTERLARAAMHQRCSTHLADLRQCMQPRGVLGGEVRCGPLHRSARSGIEPFHIELAEHCGIVIPHHASGTTLAQQGNDLVWFGVVANDIAGVPNHRIRGNSIDIGEHRLQGGKVGMHVTEHGDLHRTLPATIAASAAQPSK